jgi:hypothetical protein
MKYVGSTTKGAVLKDFLPAINAIESEIKAKVRNYGLLWNYLLILVSI